MSVALAVFVKTPSLSPVKTRLAKDIGELKAKSFYQKSVSDLTTNILRPALKMGVHVYWAVAEEAAKDHPMWSEFPVITQGAGLLGARLARVYKELSLRYQKILFMGGDSPSLEFKVIEQAIGELAETNDYVIGPAIDGGFYLFGGTHKMDTSIWLKVPYSVQSTTKALSAELEKRGQVKMLAEAFDVDELKDLVKLAVQNASYKEFLPEPCSASTALPLQPLNQEHS